MSLFLDKLNETKVTPPPIAGGESVGSKLLLKLKNKLKEKEQLSEESVTKAKSVIEEPIAEENTIKVTGSEDVPDGGIAADPPTIISAAKTESKTEEAPAEENTTVENTLSDSAEENNKEIKEAEKDNEKEPVVEVASTEEEKVNEEEHQEVKEEHQEEKPKKRGRRKKKETTTKKETSEHDDDDIPNEVIQTLDDLLAAKNDASTMTAVLINHLQDDTWKEREDYFREKITNIRIESDMNPGTLKFILCELDALRDELLPHYLEQKRTYEMLTNKDFGAAHAYRIAHATGSNAEERKRTGMLSLINATIDGVEVNLISLIASVQLRYAAMEEFMKSIQYKSNICITISGAMKIESTLTNGQV